MSTMEHRVTGPTIGHSNGKAMVALILGSFAMANLIALAVFMAVSVETLDRSSGLWMLFPFFALTGGLVAAFLGSIGWIDVRRGITDQRLFEAQFGAILGGIAAGLILLAIAVLLVVAAILALSFAADGGVMMD